MTQVSRREKEQDRIARADAELRQLLLIELREVALGRGTSFFITAYNNPWPEVRPSPSGTAAHDKAQAIVADAERLGIDTSGFTAVRLLSHFAAANDLANPHRFGPIRLAKALLAELAEK